MQRIWQQVALGGLEALRPAYQGGGRQLLETHTETQILSQHEQSVGIESIRQALETAVGVVSCMIIRVGA